MPLESLSNEQINIHDLTLEQEKKPEPEWQKQYEALKITSLYDEGEQYWRRSIGGDQKPGKLTGNDIECDVQLLDILVVNHFNKEKAWEKYSQLKRSPFYNSDGRWFYNLGRNPQELFWRDKTSSQLLGVMIENIFDPDIARDRFEKEIKPRYFDNEEQKWRTWINDSIGIGLDDQLLGLLAESYVLPSEELKERYNKFKKKYFDTSLKLWKTKDRNKANLEWQFDISNQLLSLLVEKQLGYSHLEKKYQELKESNFLDKEHGQWIENYGESLHHRDLSIRSSFDQLLGILCDYEFEKHDSNLQPSTPSLPETRSY